MINMVMCTTTFLPVILDDMLFFCQSYFDSVRDESSRALFFIASNLAKFDTPIPESSQKVIQELRANLTMGWND